MAHHAVREGVSLLAVKTKFAQADIDGFSLITCALTSGRAATIPRAIPALRLSWPMV
jgi:hypothetical protein